MSVLGKIGWGVHFVFRDTLTVDTTVVIVYCGVQIILVYQIPYFTYIIDSLIFFMQLNSIQTELARWQTIQVPQYEKAQRAFPFSPSGPSGVCHFELVDWQPFRWSGENPQEAFKQICDFCLLKHKDKDRLDWHDSLRWNVLILSRSAGARAQWLCPGRPGTQGQLCCHSAPYLHPTPHPSTHTHTQTLIIIQSCSYPPYQLVAVVS